LAMEYLDQHKLIDDLEFACWYVKGRYSKQKGAQVIAYELKKLGVAVDCVHQALGQISQQDKIQSALKHLFKHKKKIYQLPPTKQKYKASQLLYSRGFDSTVRQSAIDEFFRSQ